MKLPFDPAIPLLGLYPKNPEIPVQKNLCTPMFTAAQFAIGKCWKQPKCPSVNEWIKKLWYIYTVEYHAAIFSPICPLKQGHKGKKKQMGLHQTKKLLHG